MKFEYDTLSDKGKPIAILYKFNKQEDKQCLAIRAQYGKMIWFYDTENLASIQSNDFPDDDIIKKFYPGDKITITF